MENNICHFVPYSGSEKSIQTINFVLENNNVMDKVSRTEALYKIYCVRKGSGRLHMAGRSYELSKGDVFFTFPATPFAIENTLGLSYAYISFLGVRGLKLLDKAGVSPLSPVFYDCSNVGDVWDYCLCIGSSLSDIASESALLFAFSFITDRQIVENKKQYADSDVVSILKKYIDDNFSCSDFSLDSMSKKLRYNKKYISWIFKKKMNIGVVEYLNTIRIQNACTMMEQGYTWVSYIASKCGYSDTQYFSRVFKKKTGVSPRDYINQNVNFL